MGADTNSSPKRELGLCPKFTTKDSHTGFQGSIVTVDLPTLGATPNDLEAQAKLKERKA
jgi:hypothetical protein